MYITFTSAKHANKAEPTLALKPRGDVTRNPKQGYQWPQNRTHVSAKNFKKKNYNPEGTRNTGPQAQGGCPRKNKRSAGVAPEGVSGTYNTDVSANVRIRKPYLALKPRGNNARNRGISGPKLGNTKPLQLYNPRVRQRLQVSKHKMETNP